MKKHIVLLSIIFLAFQATTSQQQTTALQKHCEEALRSFKKSVIAPMRSRIQQTTRNLKTLYSLVTLTQENEVSPLMSVPDMLEHLLSSERALSLTKLKKAATSAGYRLTQVLNLNDTEIIKKKLDREQGDGVAAITIEPIDEKIAGNIRDALHQLSEGQARPDPSIIIELRDNWESEWEQRLHNKLIATGKVSSNEMQQFKMQINQLAQKIKDLILKIDGKHIETYTLDIRTEATEIKFDNHTHDFPHEWISFNTPALGPGSWVEKTEDGTQKKLVTLPGQAWLMSEQGRNLKLSGYTEITDDARKNPLYFSVAHGTPRLQIERLLIIIVFTLVPEGNQSL